MQTENLNLEQEINIYEDDDSVDEETKDKKKQDL